MALLPWLQATVIDIQQITYNTRSFFLQNNDIANYNFKPGQFITLDLPIDDKPARRMRSYSIASKADGSNVLELLIVLNENGKGTPYLFNEIKIGDQLTYRGPLGVFTLPEAIDKDVIFICTGTGIAPFRSMSYQLLENPNFTHHVHLIFGSRTQADLLYFEEMINLGKQYPNFYYHPVLSRADWEGKKGYVHQVYLDMCKNKPEVLFYLCGWKNMIDDAKNNIINLGYDKKAIHFELYG
jgi:ferredoxin-NADP reductase